MNFPSPLAHGQLVSRYKRFFADVLLDDGTAITAHCPNPGAMLGLNRPGLGCWVSRSEDPKRKLAWTLELVEADGGLVGINTMLPNRLVAEALAADAIPELTGYATHRREVKYGENSRVDFLLTAEHRPPCWLEIKNSTANNNGPFSSERQHSVEANNCPTHLQHPAATSRRHWVEVKNCHFSRTKGLAEFPDCVAARSTKHLRELEAMVAVGDKATVLFVVQREDCDAFSACADLDPAFSAALLRASEIGVEVLVYACAMTTDFIKLERKIEWRR